MDFKVIHSIDRLDIKNQKKVSFEIYSLIQSIFDWFCFLFCLRDISPMINIATTRIANPGVILNPEPKFEFKLLETELL